MGVFLSSHFTKKKERAPFCSTTSNPMKKALPLLFCLLLCVSGTFAFAKRVELSLSLSDGVKIALQRLLLARGWEIGAASQIGDYGFQGENFLSDSWTFGGIQQTQYTLQASLFCLVSPHDPTVTTLREETLAPKTSLPFQVTTEPFDYDAPAKARSGGYGTEYDNALATFYFGWFESQVARHPCPAS